MYFQNESRHLSILSDNIADIVLALLILKLDGVVSNVGNKKYE